MATISRNARSQPAILALWVVLYTYLWAVLPIVIVGRFLIRRYSSPLRRYPGPFIASGSRAWKGDNPRNSSQRLKLTALELQVWSTYSGHTETDHIKLHQKYGTRFNVASMTNLQNCTN